CPFEPLLVGAFSGRAAHVSKRLTRSQPLTDVRGSACKSTSSSALRGPLIERGGVVQDLSSYANLRVHQVVLQPRHVYCHPQSWRIRYMDEAVLVALNLVRGQVGRQAFRFNGVLRNDRVLKSGERLQRSAEREVRSERVIDIRHTSCMRVVRDALSDA